MFNKILLMLKGFIVTIRDRTKETWLFWSDSKTTTSITGFTKNIGSLSLFIISALAISYLVFLAYGEVTRDTIIIEEFTVPAEFPGKGYAGKALAQELYDQFIIVQDTASRWDLFGQNNNINRKISAENISNKIKFPWEDENIEISGEKISPNAIKSILWPIKTFINKHTYHISGTIQEASGSNTYQIIVRCNDISNNISYRSSVAVTKENLQAELLNSAAELYQAINPDISATYYIAINAEEKDKKVKEDNYNKAIKIINKKLNTIDEKNNYLRGQFLLAYIDYIHKHDNLAMNKLNKNIEIGDKWWLRWSYSDDKKKTLSDTYYLYSLILIYPVPPHDNDYTGGLEKLTNASKFNNKNANIYAIWGDVLYRLKRYDEAIQQYEKAIELNPNDAITYDFWGLTLVNLGRYDEAIKQYEKSLELNPNDEITKAHLKEAEAAKGKLE